MISMILGQSYIGIGSLDTKPRPERDKKGLDQMWESFRLCPGRLLTASTIQETNDALGGTPVDTI